MRDRPHVFLVPWAIVSFFGASLLLPAPGLGQSSKAGAGTVNREVAPGVYRRPLHPPRHFLKIGANQGLPQNQVLDVLQDRQGFIWIAMQSGGVARYDGTEMRPLSTLTRGQELLSVFITSLALSAEGQLLIGTGDAGISVYDPKTNQLENHPPGEGNDALGGGAVTAIAVDDAGRIWLGGAGGVLYQFEIASGTFKRLVLDPDIETDIQAIHAGPDNSVWVGTSSEGLFRIEADKRRVAARYTEADGGLTSDNVRAVLHEKDGSLWLGTAVGLQYRAPGETKFKHYYHQADDRSSLSDDRITMLLRDRDGLLWVGTELGLNTLDQERGTFVQYAPDSAYPAITSTFPAYVTHGYQDRSGVLWFGSGVALHKLAPVDRQIESFVCARGQGEPVTFIESDDDIVWSTSYKGGLYQYDFAKQHLTTYTVLTDRKTGDSVKVTEWMSALHKDEKGTLWMSGNNLGLIAFRPASQHLTHYAADPDGLDGPTANRVEQIVGGPNGNLWMVSLGWGLIRFNHQLREFSDYVSDPEEATSISSNYLYTLEFDQADPHILWLGTAGAGISRFNTRTEQAENIRLATGAKDAGMDSVLSLHQTEPGLLWLGTQGGLVRYDHNTGDKKRYTKKHGLPNDTIYAVVEDDSGRLWLPTNGGGIVVFDPASESFTAYTTDTGLLTNEFSQNGFAKGESGRIYFSGVGGFHRFDPKVLQPDASAHPVALTGFQIFNKEVALKQPIWTAPHIELDYSDAVFSFDFSALSYAAPGNIRYAYKMDGLHDWVETERKFVTYTNIEGGDYVFRVKAGDRYGTLGGEETVVHIHVSPPPWKTWWAYTLYALLVVGIIFAYLRYQARRLAALQQAHRLQTVERELELTGAVQRGFLPKEDAIAGPGFQLQGFYRPADRSGGDWWWYEESEHTLSILVGDVTGHGAGPAMVTAAAAAAFRVQGDVDSSDSDMPRRLQAINQEVLRASEDRYHMTLTAVELDKQTGTFVVHSAGGLPIMMLRPGSRPRMLPCTGTPLGSQQFAPGRIESRLDPGDRILLYTDGIPEISMPNGRELGLRKFSQIWGNTLEMSPQEAVGQFVLAADELRQHRPQEDDWTFALLEWSGG